MTMDEVLTEIENIVDSGTRVNLDYYLNAVMDEDKQDEIFEFFQDDAETGTIEEAMEELADEDYSEDEIRLMRIKFMSVTAN